MGQARRTISAPNPAPYEDVGGLRFLPRPLVDSDWTGDYHGPISAVTHDISPGREQIIGSGIGASPEGSNGSGPDGLARSILARVPSVRSWPAGSGRVTSCPVARPPWHAQSRAWPWAGRTDRTAGGSRDWRGPAPAPSAPGRPPPASARPGRAAGGRRRPS